MRTAFVLAWLVCTPAFAQIELHLDEASATPNGDEQLVRCVVRWVNASGAPIVTHTSFGRVEDGLTLELADAQGRVVLRQAYTHHRSPYAETTAVPLPAGLTRSEAVFPVRIALPRGARARLVGGLVNAGRYERGLRTRWRVLRRS